MTTPDAQIARIAGHQHQCFSRQQAAEIGYSAKQIRQRIQSGRWLSPHRDVFVLPGTRPSLQSRAMAASLALSGSVVSHATSAAIWGDLDMAGGIVHLSRRHGQNHRLDGVRLHQSRYLPDHHVTLLDGIPVTTRTRTVFDLASRLDDLRLGRYIDELVRSNKLAIEDVGVVFSELARPGRPGSVRLARVLRQRTRPPVNMSELERRFAELCARRRLQIGAREFAAPWRSRSGTRSERVDVAYEAQRVIVELDGRSYHSLLDDFENDRRRDQLALASGWRTLRFTWAQITRDPDHVERVLRATLALECQGAP